MLSAVGRRTAFGLPHRHGRTENTDSKPNDCAANNKLWQSKRSAAESLTNETEDSSSKDVLSASKLITGKHARESSDESSQDETRYYNALDGGIVALDCASSVDGVDFWEGFRPVFNLCCVSQVQAELFRCNLQIINLQSRLDYIQTR